MTPGVPIELAEKLREFLSAGKTGNITLNVKDGRIVGWQLTEFGHPSKGHIDNSRELPDNS